MKKSTSCTVKAGFGCADITGKLCVIGAQLQEDKVAELFGV